MTDTEPEIETGIEPDEHAHGMADGVQPDDWAFADDGEYATSWAIERLDDTTVQIEIHRREADLDEIDGMEQRAVGADETLHAFARSLADEDPQAAVEAAREFFGNWTGDD